MRRISRPFFALVGFMMICTLMYGQSSPAMRAHRQNKKHQAQAERLENQAEAQEASLAPYRERSVLRRRGRKGAHGIRPPATAPTVPLPWLYLETRRGTRSTLEPSLPTRG